MMLESNLYAGNQRISSKLEDLKYGVSVTDKCIGWEETEQVILATYEQLSAKRDITLHTCGMVLSGITIRNLLTTRG
jgi:3-deoxy-7-phosphoheptulonate synthase